MTWQLPVTLGVGVAYSLLESYLPYPNSGILGYSHISSPFSRADPASFMDMMLLTAGEREISGYLDSQSLQDSRGVQNTLSSPAKKKASIMLLQLFHIIAINVQLWA